MRYDGLGDIAVFGATQTEQGPDAYGMDFAQLMGRGYALAGTAKWVVVGGQTVWLAGLSDTAGQAYGLLFVFRDARGYVWHVFTATGHILANTGGPADPGFYTRANALATAFVKAAFAG
ncbi:hypothetical protein DR64_2402 [Paraburkholderia xenovorans LB400]|uniref:Uncharacterized protein n=1 Tax=Paraburkholderia xenovorans (strain LB400) TaxID=266265 RepID=Q13T92_PARXL|nr:hypothetical protein Bxe_A0235 [Paraburkholderia xenovorans LB400]AIP31772.1 hypothetical protein DR64_2402 [Paraburkholderia xenovorans LB400]